MHGCQGLHGAGMLNTVFAPERSVIVEIGHNNQVGLAECQFGRSHRLMPQPNRLRIIRSGNAK